MEGIKTVSAKVAAFIHPSRAADVPQGVHEILNSLLLRYNEEFEGVLLAYLAPKLVGHTAKILSGLSPYFHVNLTAKLLLFSPAPGMKIEGKVNKIEKDYIGVLVLGLFNTTIGVDDIRDEFDYTTTETEHIIDICGSLVEDDTGCVDWLEQHSSRSRSKGSKEVKLRSPEDKEPKPRKKSKDRRELVEELKKHPRDLEQSLPKHKKKKGMALGQSL